MTNEQVARAFSGHRFDDANAHLAHGVVWNFLGEALLHGRGGRDSRLLRNG